MMRDFALVKRADAHPADCARCHRTDMLLDLGIDNIDGYGVIYLCTVCFATLATRMGLLEQRAHELQLAANDAAWQAKLDAAARAERDHYISMSAPTSSTPEWIENELRNLADRVATAVLPDPGSGAGAALPVLAQGDEAPGGSPERVPGQDAGDPGDDGGTLPDLVGGVGEARPGVSRPADGGDGEAAGDESAADDQDDRPDGDESDEWFASLERADESDADLSADPARD